MALTVNAKAYAMDTFVSPNAVQYFGPANTASVKDVIILRRVAAKPTSTFSGINRVSVKLVRSHTLTGALTTSADSISEFSCGFPYGAPTADADAISNDLGAWIATTAFKNLLKNMLINQ